MEAAEFATLAWVYWLNRRRLLQPIADVPPAEVAAVNIQETEAVVVT